MTRRIPAAIIVAALTLAASSATAGTFHQAMEACHTAQANTDQGLALFCQALAAGEAGRLDEERDDLRKSAQLGYAPAQFAIGSMLEHGDGMPKDTAKALEWHLKAAQQGLSEAQNEYAIMLFYGGDGIKPDPDTAVPWFRKAADQGNANARTMLAEAYYFGKGVPQSYDEAFKWYQTAAAQGHPYASYMLGILYLNGQGVEKNVQTGEDLILKAAAYGIEDAQIELAFLYKTPGDRYDPVKALTFYDIYLTNPQAEHDKDLDAFAATLTQAQRDEAQSRATDWQNAETE